MLLLKISSLETRRCNYDYKFKAEIRPFSEFSTINRLHLGRVYLIYFFTEASFSARETSPSADPPQNKRKNSIKTRTRRPKYKQSTSH